MKLIQLILLGIIALIILIAINMESSYNKLDQHLNKLDYPARQLLLRDCQLDVQPDSMIVYCGKRKVGVIYYSKGDQLSDLINWDNQ